MNRDKRAAARLLILSILAVIGVFLISGCIGQEDALQPGTGEPADSNVMLEVGLIVLSPQQALTLIAENKDNPDFIIIDSRPQSMYAAAHIENAINIHLNTGDLDSFRSALNQLDKSKTYLTYCPSGCGSDAQEMKSLGFDEVYYIQDGINQWMAEGLPVIAE
jgi:rhodanese-related sulfurtransferase